jgi:hypothetical protein
MGKEEEKRRKGEKEVRRKEGENKEGRDRIEERVHLYPQWKSVVGQVESQGIRCKDISMLCNV